MPQITVENLTKTFFVSERAPGIRGAFAGLARRRARAVSALAGVSFRIEPGELVAMIGPNGAGKSTTVKILSGVLIPDRGRCEVSGRVPWKQRVEHVARIGVVFGHRTQLWWDLPVRESFDLLRAIYRIDLPRHRRIREQLVSLLNLESLLDTPVRQLSLGERMRCDLVASLLHEPEILFLDEPTLGLDAVSKLAVRDFIRGLNSERAVTVILTTHDMEDIEAVCERVLVLGEGRILADGTFEELRSRVSRERRLIVDLAPEATTQTVTDSSARLVERTGGRVTLAFDPVEIAPAELIGRVCSRHPVRDLFVEHPPIEQIIAELYSRSGEGTDR